MRNRIHKRNNWLIWLLAVYAGTVLMRFVLALCTSGYPSVGIDEFLYYSLGRSIATEGRLLYRGQPADYSYMLYPLILSPVYMIFGEGANFYRLIQLWNILLMSSSVFPLYAIGKALIRDEKKALTAAAVSMILPEFMLGQLILSESILFPLFFWLMYCVYDYIDTGKQKNLLLAGAVGGLIYSAKPGSVLTAMIFLVCALVQLIVRKNKKQAVYALGGIAVMGAVALMFWGVAQALGFRGSILSIYESKVAENGGWNLDVFVKGVIAYPFNFILSCGIIGIAYPLVKWKNWDEKQKSFWWFSVLSLAGMMIGTAWVINRVEHTNTVLNLRYIAMFIPLMLMFCFLTEETFQKKKVKELPQNKVYVVLGILLGYVMLVTVVWGCKVGADTSEKLSVTSLSVLTNQSLPLSSQMTGNVIIIALCIAVFMIFIRFRTEKLSSLCIWSLAAFMLMNGILGYIFTGKDNNPAFAKEGKEAYELTDGHAFVYVYSEDKRLDGGVDVSTKRNTDIISLNDFTNHIHAGNGYYEPFLPEKLRGFISERMTKDVDTFVFNNTSYPMVHFSSNATVEATSDQKLFYVVHFTPGQRLLDSSIGNVKDFILKAGMPGILILYDEALIQQPITIRFDISSKTDQTMEVFCTKELHTIELTKGRSWYEVTFNSPEDLFNFTVDTAEINLYAYEVISQAKAADIP